MNTVRFGVVGVGIMGTIHCQNIIKNSGKLVSLTCLCDIDPKITRTKADEFHVRGFTN